MPIDANPDRTVCRVEWLWRRWRFYRWHYEDGSTLTRFGPLSLYIGSES